MQVQVYLNFDGRCDEAIEFYRKAVGAEVLMLMRVKDSPEPPAPGVLPPDAGNKVMHVAMKIGDSTVMASDGYSKNEPRFQGFSLSLSPSDAASAAKLFNALAEGGQVTMPLGKTFWSPCFGMLTDRFGVGWMVNVTE